MLSTELKKSLNDEFGGSRIKTNPKLTKGDFSALVGTFTLSDYEQLTARNEDSGELQPFFAVTFAENPAEYYQTGKALTELLLAVESAGEDARGEKFVLGAPIKIKGGRTFKPVSFAPVD